MKLGDLLGEGQIALDFHARDKWMAIMKLVDLLVDTGRIPADRKNNVTDALLARERLASTGMDHGVALPHAQVDGLPDAVAALGLAPAGIPFKSVDGKPSNIILLLVIPRGAVRTHIRTLADIARLLDHAPLREALLASRSPQEVMRIVREGAGETDA